MSFLSRRKELNNIDRHSDSFPIPSLVENWEEQKILCLYDDAWWFSYFIKTAKNRLVEEGFEVDKRDIDNINNNEVLNYDLIITIGNDRFYSICKNAINNGINVLFTYQIGYNFKTNLGISGGDSATGESIESSENWRNHSITNALREKNLGIMSPPLIIN